MPKRRIVFGIGVGILLSCAAVFFIYGDSIEEHDTGTGIASPDAALDDTGVQTDGSGIQADGSGIQADGSGIQADGSGILPDGTDAAVPPVTQTALTETPVPDSGTALAAEPTSGAADTAAPSVTPGAEMSDAPNQSGEITPSGGRVEVFIPEGITATEVTWILEDAGIIASADDFLDVLSNKGYTLKLASGPLYLTPGTDYDELAEKVVRN